MDDATPAPTLRIELRDNDDDQLLERPLPAYEPDPAIRQTVERETYDEQILAALVSP
jgi:hypothetical protein